MSDLYKGTPAGMRDMLWDDCDRFRELECLLAREFKSAGFKEIRTPLLEYYDLFQNTGLPISQKSMYKLTDRGGDILVCRPDSTTPAARLAATRLSMRPLKLFYIQPVYRADAAHTGRGIQTLQAGAEWIGDPGADADMVKLAESILSALGAGPANLEIGYAGIFHDLTQGIGDEGEESLHELHELLVRKNFAAFKDFFESHVGKGTAGRYSSLMSMYGGPRELAEAKALLPGSKALAELECLAGKLEGRISIDFGLVGEMGYYTGMILRGYLPGAADAVLTGGRYDKLMSGFGKDEPAVGFAINLDAVCGLRTASG